MSDLLRPASEMPADDMAIAEARARRRGELLSELAQAINSTSTENASNTPDFILANFAAACLDAFAEASVAREAWYGKSLSIDGETSDIAALEARTPAPADDPDMDGTDFAHPAWWRGHHQTTEMFCHHVQAILDGRDVKDESVSPEPWHTIRQRLLALVEKSAHAHCQCAECKPWLDAEKPAPATDVDALLAKAERHIDILNRGVGDSMFASCINDLATALRESRAREVAQRVRAEKAEAERDALQEECDSLRSACHTLDQAVGNCPGCAEAQADLAAARKELAGLEGGAQ